MSSPLCNPRFLEHLKQSKAKTKDRMHLKVDRMIDRVYSEVLADLHKFFTFDDGLVRPREVQSNDIQSLSQSPQSTIAQVYNPPLDVTTAPNVSQNADHQIEEFQTLIPHSTVPTTNQLPNISESVPLEPNQPTIHSTITQLTIVKNEIDSDSTIIPLDVTTFANISFDGVHLTMDSSICTDRTMSNGNPKPVNSNQTLPVPGPIDHTITQDSSSPPIVKSEMASDSEENPTDYNEADYELAIGLEVDQMMEFNDDEDVEECECNDCLNDFKRLHQNISDGQPNDTRQDQSPSRDNKDDEYEVDQETWDELGREIKEEIQERNNRESILAPTDILDSQNAFDSVHSLGSENFLINDDGHSNQQKANKNQYAKAHDLDESDEMSYPPAKKAKMGSDNPANENSQITGQSARTETQNPTQSTQPNKSSANGKQIHTLSVQCLKSGCLRVFAQQDQLNLHMWNDHSIRLFRCWVKDCRQSFDKCHILRDHIQLTHQSTTQWNCDKCSKHFTNYRALFSHNYLYHQFGHFQCSFPTCTFTGEYKMKVYNHYTYQHKPTNHKQTFNCQNSSCQFRTSNESYLRIHELNHLGIKPYRCTWPECYYASSNRSATIGHIRRVHFLVRNPNAVPNEAQLRDPSEYLEVMHELLQQ